MNQTHIHLLLNHFPVIGTLIGSCLLLWGIIKKNTPLKSISSFLLVLMAVLAVPVFFTGEPAEESVEHLTGISEQAIELHEEAAETALWLMGITGIAALAAMVMAYKKLKQAGSFFIAVFILSALCFASMARTGYLGGQIRHTEISSNTTGAENPADAEEQGNVQEQKKEKDDD